MDDENDVFHAGGLPGMLTRDEIAARSLTVALEVDGGVGPDTLGPLAEAGVSIAVAGAAVFGADDPVAAIRRLQSML